MSDHISENPTRRKFLKGMAAFLGITLGQVVDMNGRGQNESKTSPSTALSTHADINNKALLIPNNQELPDKDQNNTELQPPVDIAPSPNNQTSNLLVPILAEQPINESEVRNNIFKQKLNEILSMPLDDKRATAESEFIEGNCNLLTEIDQTLAVITHPAVRTKLLLRRYGLRQKGSEDLIPLSEPLIEWSVDHKLHPEILGLCLDIFPQVQEIINSLYFKNPEAFRPDLVSKIKEGSFPPNLLPQLNAFQFMINAGGLAKLIWTETGSETPFVFNGKTEYVGLGLVNIGKTPAVNNFNPKFFPDYLKDLQSIIDSVNNKTGLKYQADNIPGSQAGSTDCSGGAVSIQMMPNVIKKIIDNSSQALNPFDIKDAILMAWIFLALGEQVSNNEYRFGYLKDIPQALQPDICARIREAALVKWNPSKIQVNKILKTAEEYYDKIVKPGLSIN